MKMGMNEGRKFLKKILRISEEIPEKELPRGISERISYRSLGIIRGRTRMESRKKSLKESVSNQ